MPNLLIVDDSVDVAVMICEMLEREGYGVSVCYNGEEAINLFKSGQTFDMVITDLLMPKVDGVGLINYLKKTHPSLPIIVFSGGGVTINSKDALMVVSDSAAATLQKPVNCQALISEIEKHLAS